jgi:hypothetical protein
MLYNNETLKLYCDENNIKLLENYTNVKINRDNYIKGVCKTKIETCDKIFNKNFRQLVKTGPYCLNCAIENGKQKHKLKCKFNLQYLIAFCDKNNITLNEDYENKLINRDTPITGICLTENCNNNFNKTFRELVKLNGYCFDCSKEKGKLKIIKTNLEKFGVDNPMKNNEIKEKLTQTMITNYGVEHISQTDKFKQMMRETSLQNYGTEHPLQSEIVRNKSKETNKIKYGFENPQQNKEVQEKTSNTIYNKYGVKCYFNTDEFKEKTRETNLLKYGVPHHSQNSEISELILKNSFKTKQYIFPSGKIINYQGYENFAFDELIHIENILEEDILTNRRDVPEIWYRDKNNKLRRHFVDIYIKSQNRCIEVKSTWTNQEKNNVLEKQLYAINLGYKYEIWIFDKNGNKLQVL